MSGWSAGLTACGLVLLLAGCGATVALNQQVMEMQGTMVDYRDILTARADTLRVGEESPRWQRPLEELEIDGAAELPGGEVLVGLVEIDPLYGGPSYGPYVAVRPETGEELWRWDRSGDPEDLFAVVLTDPVVLVQRLDSRGGSAAYLAVDPETGEGLWTEDVEADHQALPNPEAGYLFLAEGHDDGVEYRALDLTSGSPLWTRTVGAVEGPPTLELFQGRLIAAGASVRALDATSGEELWVAEGVGRDSVPSLHMMTGEGLIVVGEEGRVTRLSAAGEPAWSVELPAAVTILSGGEGRVFALAGAHTEGSPRLFTLSLDDGSREWDRVLDGGVHSPFVATRGRLVFTRREAEEPPRLVVLDLATGEALSSPTVPLPGGSPLPDRVLPYEDQVVVAAERGVAAYGWSEDEWLWSRSIEPDVTHEEALEGLRGALDRLAELAGVEAQDRNAAQVSTLSENLVRRSLLEQALARQRSVYRRTDRAATSGDVGERIAASRSRLLAVEQSLVAARMQFASEEAAAGAEMVAAAASVMAEAAENARRTWPATAQVRAGIRHAVAVRQHEDAVGDGYYVRAHRTHLRGPLRWSVLVVDLETGRWTDVSTSPGTGAYLDSAERFGTLAVQYPLLTSGGTLVVKGLGLDPDRWTPLTIGTSRVVEPSLLGYDLESLELHGPDEQYSIAGAAIIDTEGRSVGQPGRFRNIMPFSEGLASVAGRNEMGWEIWGLIDRDGEVVVPPRFLDLFRFREGLAPFILAEELNNVGFVNREGEVAIEPGFSRLDAYGTDEPYGFSNGLAQVEIDGTEYAYIDTTGQFVIPPGTVGEGGLFVEGRASVERHDAQDFFPRKGYIDTQGEVVIPFDFIEASPFSDGLAVVEVWGKEGGAGFIDRSGNWVVGPTQEWEAVGLPLAEDRAPVMETESGNRGYVDRRGDWAVPPTFELARGFHQGRAAVYRDGGWGFIDRSGAIVLPLRFDEVLDFSQGLAAVKRGEHWGYVRLDGSWAIRPRYRDATRFDSDRAVVRLDGKAWVTVPD